MAVAYAQNGVVVRQVVADANYLDILKEYTICQYMELDKTSSSQYTENDFTLDLGRSFGNKENLFCRFIAKEYGTSNTFYSLIRADNTAINVLYYRNMGDTYSFNVYLSAINQVTFTYDVFNSSIPISDNTPVQFSSTYYNDAVFLNGYTGRNVSIQNRENPETYTDATFSKLVLYGPSYNSGSKSQHGIFQEFIYWKRDLTDAIHLVPAQRKSDSKKGIVDLVSGTFWELPDYVTVML